MTEVSLSNSLADLAARIRAEHEQVASAMQAGLVHALKAGELLLEAKKHVEHGQWEAWASEQCGIHERTAQLYMRLVRELPRLDPAKAKRVSLLSFREAVRLVADHRKTVAVIEAAEAEPEKYGRILADMEKGGRPERSFKLLTVAKARDDYERRKQNGGTVSDLEALAASGFRAAAMLIDWPLLYETRTENGRIWTSASNHYTEMTIEEIKAFAARYVAPLAADSSLLFMWFTWPLLVLGHHVDIIKACGFDPKTLAFDWVKTNPSGEGLHWGNGYWTRSNPEPCFACNPWDTAATRLGCPPSGHGAVGRT